MPHIVFVNKISNSFHKWCDLNHIVKNALNFCMVFVEWVFPSIAYDYVIDFYSFLGMCYAKMLHNILLYCIYNEYNLQIISARRKS